MNTGKKYHTRQMESILNCIRENADAYITIQTLSERLQKMGSKVGLTTIYRNLDKLEQENRIIKVHIEGESGTCYRYLPEEAESSLFCMKCESCGCVINISCSELWHLYEHVSAEHRICINPRKTMFYGSCSKCSQKNQEDYQNETSQKISAVDEHCHCNCSHDRVLK